MRRTKVMMHLVIALAVLTSCAAPAGVGGAGATPNGDLRTRLVAANLLAGTIAEGLAAATRAHAISPGSDRATAIEVALTAVERSLDGAGAALRAGLPELATRQISAAEFQLDGLQPLLPPDEGEGGQP